MEVSPDSRNIAVHDRVEGSRMDGLKPGDRPAAGVVQVDKAAPSSFAPVFAPAALFPASGQEQLLKILNRLGTFAELKELPESGPLRQALPQLTRLFEGFDPAAPLEQRVYWLRMALEDCGLFYENRLADALSAPTVPGPETLVRALALVRRVIDRDLKAHLLNLQKEAVLSQALESGESAHLRRTIDRLLTYVDQQQESACRRSAEGAFFQVLHLLPVPQSSRPVQLKMYYPRKGRLRAASGHKATVLLEMDRLGPVRIDIGLLKRTLTMTFNVRSRSARDLFERHTPVLSAALEGFFDQVRISTRLSRRPSDIFEGIGEESSSSEGVDLHA